MPTRLQHVVVDAADPAALARWWAAALGWAITFEEPDEVAVEDLAGLLVDERHRERLLDGKELGPRLELGAQHDEHPPGEVEQALLGLFLPIPERLVLGLQVPVMWVIAVKGTAARGVADSGGWPQEKTEVILTV